MSLVARGRDPSVRHARVPGVVRTHHGCVRDDDDVVEIRAESAFRPSAASGLDRGSGGKSNIIGSHPEQKTDDGTTLDADSLVGADLSRMSGFVALSQQPLQGLMGL
jgi:hypothetical protein